MASVYPIHRGVVPISHTWNEAKSRTESLPLALPIQTSEPEANDKIEMLPVAEKKPSCILTNVVSTCVNKASAHLELLQTLIEEWFAQLPKAGCEEHSYNVAKESPVRTSAVFKSKENTASRLSVTGLGVKSSKNDKGPAIADELPYLGGMEVIEEVFALISRLESDRQQAERDLLQEKQRARFLQRKTDELVRKRAREFPSAVQAEHNAAVEDLSELHWHVTYKKRAEEKLKDRVDHANAFNVRLLDDIAFVQKHCPLVEEKLALEENAMEKIEAAQIETSAELEAAQNRLAKTKVRNEEAHVRAANERVAMVKEIEDVKEELQNAVTELADARMLSNTYTHQTSDTRLQIAENVEEKKVLLVKVDNAKMTEQMQIRKVEELTNKIRMIESELHRLEEDAFKKQEELTVTTNTMESQYSELQRACEHEQSLLKKITQQVDDILIEIDNLTRKISKCETGITEDEKSLRRMTTQINNTEMMMNQVLEEFNKVQVINSAIREKLQEEKERIAQIEEALRLTLETLKKQCKDEIHTRSVLHTRIDSDGTELVKSQVEAKQKKEKLAKTVVEIEQQLQVVVEKVDKLRDVYNSKKEILEALELEIEETKAAKEKVVNEFVVTKEELNPYLEELKTENLDLKGQLQKLDNKIELMSRKKDEMDHTAKVLSKSIKQNEVAVDKLRKELDEANIQLEAQTNLGNSLLSSRDDVLRRMEQRSKEHSQLMAERSVTITKHTETLQKELGMNQGLAMKYRLLQGQYVDMKSQVMDMFDERNRLEAGIKDLKQLKGLQSRMTRALETYYKFRGMFNSGELDRVQAENRISGRKLALLQDNFTGAVDGITKFLKVQMSVLDKREVVKEHQLTTKVQSTSSTNIAVH